MHTLVKYGDVYAVGYYQNRGDSPAIFKTLFKDLSFPTAFNVVCAMNGGDGKYDNGALKVLEMCQPKEKL